MASNVNRRTANGGEVFSIVAWRAMGIDTPRTAASGTFGLRVSAAGRHQTPIEGSAVEPLPVRRLLLSSSLKALLSSFLKRKRDNQRPRNSSVPHAGRSKSGLTRERRVRVSSWLGVRAASAMIALPSTSQRPAPPGADPSVGVGLGDCDTGVSFEARGPRRSTPARGVRPLLPQFGR